MPRRHTMHDYFAAPANWFSTLTLLMAEHFGSRYKRTRFAAIIAVVEPMGVIGLFAFTHQLTSSLPAYGSSDLLFFSTGILPFYLFFHISWTIRSWDVLRRIPRMTEFDLLLSHVLDEYLIKLIIITIFSSGLWMYGVSDAIPNDPLQCLLALAILAVMGAGIGLLNAVVGSFFVAWTYMYAILIRFFMAFSGALTVVDWMPPLMRDYVVWNPISHAITWYRAGYYSGYPTMTLDREYAVISAALIFALGVVTLNFTKQWRPTK